MKTKQVARSRGQRCGDIEVAGYLVIELGGYRVTGGAPGLPPGPLVLDLRIPHHRFGSVSDPGINGRLYFPNDLDGTLNETAADKIQEYRADYNNRPSNSISFRSDIASTSMFT